MRSITDACDPHLHRFTGLIRPVYSCTQRKLKLHDIALQHRRLTFQERQPSVEGDDCTICMNIELLAMPSFVQCESYRSVAHFYTHIHEQMLRFVGSPDKLEEAMQLPAGAPTFPFAVR